MIEVINIRCCRLRDVCRALQETQEIAMLQREKLDMVLANEEEYRELVRISYLVKFGPQVLLC